jgi:hypothetical protein
MNWILKWWLPILFLGGGWAYLILKPSDPLSIICFGFAAILTKLESLK